MSTITRNSQSQLAKETAEKFIAHFSQPQNDQTVCSAWTELLTDEDKQRLDTEYAQGNLSSVNDKEDFEEKETRFYWFCQAKHYRVFGHHSHPQVVFKRVPLRRRSAAI